MVSEKRINERGLKAAVFMLVAALFVMGLSVKSAAAQDRNDYVPGEIIVRYKDNVSQHEQTSLERLFGDRLQQQFDRINARALKLPVGQSVAQAVARYQRDPRVVYAEPNYIVSTSSLPNDPSFGMLYGLRNTGQTIQNVAGTVGADIKADPAWDISTGSETVVVGVVDTGIDYTHPDLAANVWSNPGGIGGCPAGTFGYNAISNGCDPKDDHYHGTHVSGTIGAVGNNGLGVTGVNWRTSIMGLKFLSASGSGTTTDAIEAIDFAVQAKIAGVNIRVLSNSWGGGGYSQALFDEIKKANDQGILFVAAAGNNSRNTDFTANYPATYNVANIVSVAATDNRDKLASFSNYGSTSVDLGAPGVNTLSTTPNAGYGYLSGTSMATPHVSGAAALMLAVSPTLTMDELKTKLLGSVDLISALSGKTVTGGRLNVCRALPGCVIPTPSPDYALSISPNSQSVSRRGGTLSYAVNISRTNGHTNPVDFSISGLPSSITAISFSPDPTTGNSSQLSFSVPAATQAKTYTFTVIGLDTVTSISKTATATLRKR